MKVKDRVKSHGLLAHAYILIGLFGAFAILLEASPRASFAQELLETGSARSLRTPPVQTPKTIKIVSYNMRWRGGEDLRELIFLLRNDAEIGSADIIGVQEIDRNKKRTHNTNTARMIADELGMHYAWAAPPLAQGKKEEEEETGVAIFSRYPLAEVSRIVLPNEGPGGRRRAALGATVQLSPQQSIRVYSVHAETRTTNERRLQQFQSVLDDLAQHSKTGPAVVLGDFNTITGDDVRSTTQLFTNAHFQTPFPDSEPTWKTFILKLKLDWIWLRGLHSVAYGIDRKIGLSDHWPLWITVKLSDEKSEGAKQPGTVR